MAMVILDVIAVITSKKVDVGKWTLQSVVKLSWWTLICFSHDLMMYLWLLGAYESYSK